MKIALISGITGQDGSYLSQLLLDKGYKVVGLTRGVNRANLSNLSYLKLTKLITLHKCNLQDLTQIKNIIKKIKPDEVYNLAGQSSVSLSFLNPKETLTANFFSTLNLLEAVRLCRPQAKLYQATSCEIYGSQNSLPINEESPLHPSSPYGVSKAACHLLIQEYRQSYGLFAVSGVLFNHESHLRSENYFIRKLIRTSIAIAEGSSDFIYLGQAKNKRDFGYSPKYVEAMWLMLQQTQPKDLIICSGRSVSIRSIAEYVLRKFNLSKNKIKIDPTLFRNPNVGDLFGDNFLAKQVLGWHYDMDFFSVLDILIREELTSLSKLDKYPRLAQV